MKSLLFEIERWLRWLSGLTAEEKSKYSMEISEASQVYWEQLEPIVDEVESHENP